MKKRVDEQLEHGPYMVELKKPTISLISYPHEAVKLINKIWDVAKSVEENWDDVENSKSENEKQEIFKKVIDMSIPCSEALVFTFVLENISISFHNQATRQRTAMFWVRSGRIYDSSKFFEKGDFRLPETVNMNKKAVKIFLRNMEMTQSDYNDLIDLGIPIEDARELLPMGQFTRLSYTVNFRNLVGMFKKRGCWILQYGLWHDVIKQMLQELSEKVHPMFRYLNSPPCMKGDECTSCPYVHDNERREKGTDLLPPCPLWLDNILDKEKEATGQWRKDPKVLQNFSFMSLKFQDFWDRDPKTGIRLSDTTPEELLP